MQRSKWIWLVLALVLLSYIVPYGLLRHLQVWYGSFLFWTIVGLAVIAINIFITRDFEEHNND